MRFDDLVNKLLGEAISATPQTTAIPKKISDIGTAPQTQQQVQGQVQQPVQQPKQDSSSVDALAKQLADNEKKEEERAKKEQDSIAKLIATMTASAAKQQPQQPATTTPQTNLPPAPNQQNVISNLQKLGKI